MRGLLCELPTGISDDKRVSEAGSPGGKQLERLWHLHHLLGIAQQPPALEPIDPQHAGEPGRSAASTRQGGRTEPVGTGDQQHLQGGELGME
jgi:hypothetical protein